MLKLNSTRLLLGAAGILTILIFGFFARSGGLTEQGTRPYIPQWQDAHEALHQDPPLQEPTIELIPEPANVPYMAASPSSIPQPTQIATGATESQNAGSGSLSTQWDKEAYTQVSSRMSSDGKWFPINFGDYNSYNPNLIPHPWKNDTWVMIAQGKQDEDDPKGGPVYSLELVCDAEYIDGKMKCTRSPISVPIASTVSDHCTDKLAWFNYFIGPNDPRVFFGPDRPYITYGSASQYTCLGQWIHDLRRLVKWDSAEALDRTQRFFWPTELQRPKPYGGVEKNWFAFWDAAGEMYLHYNIYPSRSFAGVSTDGSSITEDLAPQSARKDNRCLQEYMPKLGAEEHIHQATNSLAITMCSRRDSSCDKVKNTFIFTIFHHKLYNNNHNLYEPYVMSFHQSPPFGIHSIASKPFWINGRGKPGETTSDRPAGQSQMMYITSMSWKDRNTTYQGYMDDDLMISFGVEDRAAGAIDVRAGDLFQQHHICT
ncbi:hypothetical protein AMS68_004155 [Peltaster fructicola]|uniref:Uncharacterized protein n=1 Tax=Peltaster fructicola TaxID=286661 RepID=A0A6H0XVK4_9PEZI|nr:hypothetical protein AMS68_004155 [Peltaster fructicola]